MGINTIKLISIGKINVLSTNTINNPNEVKRNITTTLHDLSIQEWHTIISKSSKGRNYNVFKEILEFEPYLKFLPRKQYIPLLKFRT